MKKKLFMVFLAAFSLAVVPSCDKEDENDGIVNVDGDNQDVEDNSTFDLLAGKYSGSLILGLTNEVVANPLYVNLETKEGNKIDLSLDPITILSLEIKDLNFKDIEVSPHEDTWKFALDTNALIPGEDSIPVSVPVSVEGVIAPKNEKDQLEFSVKVSQEGIIIPLDYKGMKQ
ncbi:MAG: hypothetical protein IKL19_01390 [Paludibacteraceae bacterium]|nr:hypothetical protein [Paludibacteraceae bacterium]